MTDSERCEVPPDAWFATHEELKISGQTFFDLLVATDLGHGQLEIVTHVMAPDASQRVLTRTTVRADEPIRSLAQIYLAAGWHEREAHDLLGISFNEHPDPRALIFDGAQHPLRREEPLTPRIDTAWPGTYEPGAQPGTTRRKRPKPVPGVNPEWLSDTQAPK
ncbi:MAG: NADH-quinone oxidoreductase subunit C [Actinobacteria bacterium]|nr:NADH-quinone oxidoreductase subunit C [Actinomycetota bacterium]